jgi:hypothetical protein
MSRVWVTIKRLGRIIKFLLVCLVITVCVFMGWRLFSTGIPSDIKILIPNDELKALYSEQGNDMVVFEQKYDDITRANYNEGYFAVPEAVFIPDANQAQVVFRYNNSTIRRVAVDKGLESVPDREKDLFDVSLVLYIDLTPDNLDDNEDVNSEGLKKIRVRANSQKCERTTLYNFYRFSFDFDEAEEAVDIKQLMEDGTLIAVHTQFYYLEGLDYNEAPYGALNIYYHQRSNYDVKLSSKDKKVLGE